MDFVGWILLNVADLLRWAGRGLLYAGETVWHWADAALNPVLSPVFSFLNPICTSIADACYTIFGGWPPWVSLALISTIAGGVMLIGFRYTSNQAAIGRARDEITANLLALKLFKDQLRATIKSQGRLFCAIVKLQVHMILPVLIMALPMMLVMGQMGVRHQWRPLRVGQPATVRVTMRERGDAMPSVSLVPSDAVSVEVEGIAGAGEIVWRIRPHKIGHHRLELLVNGESVEKEIVVTGGGADDGDGGVGFDRVSAERTSANWIAQILHPVEPLLPERLGIETISVSYPPRASLITGSNYWLLSFFVVSMAAALALKPVFRVRF